MYTLGLTYSHFSPSRYVTCVGPFDPTKSEFLFCPQTDAMSVRAFS